MNWQNVIALLIAGIFGFIFKILHGKLFEKKVNLYFELDKPTFFSVIPPTVCFQNIKIWNKGNLPAQGLKINLNNELINEYNVMYKSSSEENYDKEVNETILTLKFAKLLPQEELTISFKSEKPIPQNFLINVKSDEMIARSIVTEKKSNEWVGFVFSIIIVGILVFAGLGVYDVFFAKKTLPERIIEHKADTNKLPFSQKLMIDKNIYMAGQKIEIIYQIANTSNETLKDITFILEIPGIELDYDTKYQEKSFLKMGEQVTYKRSIRIPNDFPHEKHKISLNVLAKSLENSFRDETFVYFEVQ